MKLCRPGQALLLLTLFASACMPSLVSGANITNYFDNPTTYTNDFESYTNLQWLAAGGGTDGWYAAEEDALIVVTQAPPDYVDFPLTNSPHTKVLELASDATNLVTSTNVITDGIYVDMALQPRRWEEDAPPEIDPDNRMGMYFDTNGQAVVYADFYDDVAKTNGTNWIALSGFTVASGQWVRVTIELKMNQAGASDYFQVRLDGIALQNQYGVKGTLLPGSTNNPGSWFKCPADADYIKSVTFNGTGYLDDLQVSTNAPFQGNRYTVDVDVDPYGTAQITSIGKIPIETEATWSFVEGETPIFILSFASDGYNITNVLVDSVPRSPSSAPDLDQDFSFSGITTNHTYSIQTAPEDRQLVVTNYPGSLAYNASPADGLHTNKYNDVIQMSSSLDGTPLNTETSRHWCTHMTFGPGNNVFESTQTNYYEEDGTNFSFKLQCGTSSNNVTTNMWNWRLQHKLDITYLSEDPYFVSNYSASVSGVGWYDDGSNAVITVTTNGNWYNVGWTGNTGGCSGSTVQYTVPMDQPRTIYAHFLYNTNGSQHTVTVISERGFPSPVTGSFDDGADMFLSIGGSPTNVTSSNRFACVGWENATGSVPSSSGTSTNTPVFKLIENTSITWKWEDQNKLTIQTSGSGSGHVLRNPDPADEWYATNSQVTLDAETYVGSGFGSWSGTTNGISDLTASYQPGLSMDIPRTLDAYFTNAPVVGTHGTPSTWYQLTGIQSFYYDIEEAETDDHDSDSMANWQEYWTGTDPDDSNSLFQVIEQQYGASSNCVIWYGSTNYGVTNYFSMLRSTNLMVGPAGWEYVESNTLQRAADGTNVWWDTDVSTSNLYNYRPTLLITY